MSIGPDNPVLRFVRQLDTRLDRVVGDYARMGREEHA